MKNMIIILIILFSFSWSQVASDHAYTGAESMALVGAVVANPGATESIFHNPGGLAEVTDIQFITGSAKMVDVPFTYFGVLYPVRQFGTVGISLQQSKVSAGSTSLSKETDLGISNGFYLQKDQNSQLMLGYTLHLYQWSLGRSAGISGDGSDGFPAASGSSAGVDVGILAVLRGKHRVGAWLKNINSPTIGDGNSAQYLPQRMTVGVAYLPYKGLTTSLVFDRLLGVGKQVKGGIDYDLTDIWTIRVGVQSNPNRMGAGFGIHYQGFTLDYAVLTHPVLPLIQQISLGYTIP